MKKNRGIYSFISWVLIIVVMSTSIPVYAKKNNFKEIVLKLNDGQEIQNDKYIATYLNEDDGEYYISIDDLCELARCEKSVDGDIITVRQGVWYPKFNVKEETFDDGYQNVNVTILKVDKDEYAVSAIMFLYYFKAISAIIDDKTLYCRMPATTEWETLDVDYGSTQVDTKKLYGGKVNVVLSLTLDIIADLVMGEFGGGDAYYQDAYNETLSVDLKSLYKDLGINAYVESIQSALYNDLNSEKGKEFLEKLKENTEKPKDQMDVFSNLANPIIEQYVQDCFHRAKDSILNLSYNEALEKGTTIGLSYETEYRNIINEENTFNQIFENRQNDLDAAILLISIANSTAGALKYFDATNNIIYDVMGKENRRYLNISDKDNSWFKIADKYKDALGITQTQVKKEVTKFFESKVWIDEVAGKGLAGLTNISEGFAGFSIFMGQEIAKIVPLSKNAYEGLQADRKTMYLTQLQKNEVTVLQNIVDKLQKHPDDEELYNKYIQAEILYCRTSIAMFDNLKKVTENLGLKSKKEQEKDKYWLEIYEQRKKILALSLYQLTAISEDGATGCLPLDLKEYQKSAVDADNVKKILEKFVSKGEYQNYTKDVDIENLEYAFADIDGNRAVELLIQSNKEQPFYTTWLFTVKNKKDVVLVTEQYGYGQWRQAYELNAVAGSPEFKPFKDASCVPFYKLSGTDFALDFEVLKDEGTWYYSSNGEKEEIDESAASSYIDQLSEFLWLPIKDANTTAEDEEKLEKEWKEAYTNHVKENGNLTGSFGDALDIYALVDINGDSVPELYGNLGTTANGDFIATYSKENGLVVQPLWNNGFTYIPKRNLFREVYGHMDQYEDRIYSIEKGNFVVEYKGVYGSSEVPVPTDTDGMPIYTYNWEGEEMSEEDYEQRLGEVYNTDEAIDLFEGAEYVNSRYVGNGLCSYQEILDKIANY